MIDILGSTANVQQHQQPANRLLNSGAVRQTLEARQAPGSSAGALASAGRPVPGANDVDRSSELYKVAQEFEAIFIKQMLSVMRGTVEKNGLMGGGSMAEDIFEDMLYDEYSLTMAQSANFGLTEQIYRQLSSIQQIPLAEDALDTTL